MSFYNVTNDSTFRVADPAVRTSQQVNLLSSVTFPTALAKVTTPIIPASALLGGSFVSLDGDLTSYQFDSASNILAALRTQVNTLQGKIGVSIPNGTTFKVNVYNNNPSNDDISSIDQNEVDPTDWIYYNNTDTVVYWGCSAMLLFTVCQQKALGDANDWINVTCLDY